MWTLFSYPVELGLCSFAALLAAAALGSAVRAKRQFDERTESDITLLVSAALTLLGLILGFSFSMAVSRYDLRKEYEENEANAIHTEYFRVELLPSADAANVQMLLREYTAERIAYYRAHDESNIAAINAGTATLQQKLWQALLPYAKAHQTPTVAAVVTGMNDAINTQGYTEFAWQNRIPPPAWILMLTFGLLCCALYAFKTALSMQPYLRMSILPLILSVAYFLIADLDSPRYGFITLYPHELITVQQAIST